MTAGDGFEDRSHDAGNGPGDREWWTRWKQMVGDDLMGNYGTLVFPDRTR